MPPAEVQVSGGLRQGQGHEPSGGGAINPTLEPALPWDWGNRPLEGQAEPVCTRAQDKGAGTPQETDPDLPVSVQESPVEAWVAGGLVQGRGH